MTTNLLRPSWARLDSHELRILLGERIGEPGQSDRQRTGPERIHLPRARVECRVILTYRDRQIVSVEPGEAFDVAQWERIAEEIETTVLMGPLKVGRDYSFSAYRVQGSWRGQRSGVQILPPHPEAPRAPAEMAEHPFILEFPFQVSGVVAIDNHRRIREHRNLTLVLNTLLAGRTNLQPRRGGHFWAVLLRQGGSPEIRWAQGSYFAPLGEAICDAPSQLPSVRLEEINADNYFTEVRGIDGRGLRVPADLDESIWRYQQLQQERRVEFNRAAFWLDMASRQWTVSMSASFAALVSTIESLINTRGPGSARRFRDFLERHAPGASLETRRNEMYDVRSGILHGSQLMTIDEDLAFGWDPPFWNERELNEELWTLTRTAVRNWLKGSS